VQPFSDSERLKARRSLMLVKRNHGAVARRFVPFDRDGGAEGIRTPDPHNAIVVLYQLSYDPIRAGAI
jgi:hypothetical protein